MGKIWFSVSDLLNDDIYKVEGKRNESYRIICRQCDFLGASGDFIPIYMLLRHGYFVTLQL